MRDQPNSLALLTADRSSSGLLTAGGLLTLGICTLTALAVLSLSASPAFAERIYESQISGLGRPTGLAIDSAGNVWVSDQGNQGFISEYGPYPSETKIGEQKGDGVFGNSDNSIAIASLTGHLYVAESGAVDIDVFNLASGAFEETWPTKNNCGGDDVGVDNSAGITNGRVYIGRTCDDVTAFIGSHTEAPFAASGEPGKGYINGNELTGTPSESFESLGGVNAVGTDGSGDLYVLTNGSVNEFASSGTFIQSFNASEVPGGFADLRGVAVDPTSGNILIDDSGNQVVDEFSPSGKYLEQLTGIETPYESFPDLDGGIGVNSEGHLYLTDGFTGTVAIFSRRTKAPKVAYKEVKPAANSFTAKAAVDPNGGGNVEACHFEYGITKEYGSLASCSPDPASNPPSSYLSSPTEVSADVTGLKAQTTYHFRIVVTDPDGTIHGTDQSIETLPAVTNLSTDAATGVTNAGAEIHASFTGENLATTVYFEYGTSPNYGLKTTAEVVGPATGTQKASAELTGLVPNTHYYYRVVAENQQGKTISANEQDFTTLEAPTIESLSYANSTATTADLIATVNPQGFETKCQFEYGKTISYGTIVPCPEALTGSGGKSVKVHLTELQGTAYYFRITAESKWGSTTSEGQSFEFYPPNCPNSSLRQQTGSNYLPDCRGYELVSPTNAEGTLFYPGGPNSGQATDPSRLSFTGLWGEIPGANAINTGGDLYVSTRSDQGWSTKYVGIPGEEAGCAGGPPTEATTHEVAENPPWLTNSVQTNSSMSEFLDWNDGAPIQCYFGTNALADANARLAPQSNAPYLWNADGSLVRHLPTDLSEVPQAENALRCPYREESEYNEETICHSETHASSDLTHLAFSSSLLSFAGNEGLTEAPGSAYDDNLNAGTVDLISKVPSGAPIPQPAGSNAGSGEFIRFPGVSTDGSHIVMSTATRPTPFCDRFTDEPEVCPRFTDSPVHLYMSVDDLLHFNVSENQLTHESAAVRYVGMTPDGKDVFFTSEEQLNSEDHDHSTDLYRWSAEDAERGVEPLTLISKGDNSGAQGEPGNTDECSASWSELCGVLPYSGYAYSWLTGGLGGNGSSDSAISDNGDIYFFSPEQLDGTLGVPGKQNLYDFRAGAVNYVTTFNPGGFCEPTGFKESAICSESAITRLEVSPDDSHMAFITADRMSSYNNAGHLEMYSYLPANGTISCDSCNPNGQAATANVYGSQDGLFMTNDGRTFFSTTESLVSQDTDEANDVYEYVHGQPRLISPGTGTSLPPQGTQLTFETGENLVSISQKPGLIGVSANGTDAYFSTFDALVPEDHNGDFLRIYDARTDGGFAQPAPMPPCSAAEECHGSGSSAPELPTQGTAAALVGGNATRVMPRRHAKRRNKHIGRRRKHPRSANRRAGGGR